MEHAARHARVEVVRHISSVIRRDPFGLPPLASRLPLPYPAPMPTILIVVADLMFQSRIEIAARDAGATPVVADTAAALDAALAADADAPAAVIVDLHITGINASEAIQRAKRAGARVLAFGRHTEPATLRAARDAGADTVVPRSTIAEELPALLASLLA